MKYIRWRSPENTKPRTSKWHRNHEAMAEWYFRWWIDLMIPGPAPEEHFHINDMMQMVDVPQLVLNCPCTDTEKCGFHSVPKYVSPSITPRESMDKITDEFNGLHLANLESKEFD